MEITGDPMDQATLELTQKIDLLTAQVAYLTEQAQIAERARQDREDLLQTMMPVAKDAMRLATEQLDDVQAYLHPEDLVRLLKKIIRHGSHLELMVDQIDGVMDLLSVAGPITKEAVAKATVVFDDLDRKGYFAFAGSGMRMADNVVTSFTAEDANRLADNIVLILNTVKDMTQPEIMNFLRTTLLVSEKEIEKPVDTGYLSLLKQINDPAVRRGLALTLRVLRVVGQQAV
jgi:uncharacterized protein YjgD (DUF1641 family)